MRNLCEAYIELAYVNVSQFKNERGTVKYFILVYTTQVNSAFGAR